LHRRKPSICNEPSRRPPAARSLPAFLVLAFAAATQCLAAGLVWPPITETPTSRYEPGRWVWVELFTEDVNVATRFYREAFDWSFQSYPAPRGPGYMLALSEGEPVGGMIQREHSQVKERGSRWVGMISVPDVKAAARYAAEHGGKVVATPRMLEGRGEVALLQDPEGAPFGVIRAVGGDPPDYLAEDRQWVWIELWARDPDAVARFYSGLAGYESTPFEEPNGRTGYLLASGKYTRGGIVATPAPNLASAWIPYLRVEDAKAAADRAQRAGAKVLVPPRASLRDGRVALMVDPTGAPLGVAVIPATEVTK
jgi:hypothetical protein